MFGSFRKRKPDYDEIAELEALAEAERLRVFHEADDSAPASSQSDQLDRLTRELVRLAERVTQLERQLRDLREPRRQGRYFQR